MSTSFTKLYQITDDNADIKLTLNIGEAQKGVTSIKLNTNTLLNDSEGNVELVVGKGSELKGKTIHCTTTVTDIRTETNQTSVTYKITGGSPYTKILGESVDNHGDVIFYTADIVFY